MSFLGPFLIVLTISILGISGGILLIYRENWARLISKNLINFSIGAILGVVFLDLLPEVVEKAAEIENILVYSLAGILIFYFLEKTLLWYHHHSEEQVFHKKHTAEEKAHPVAYLVTFGDGLHNFIDGLVIAAAFLIDFKLGLATSIAVLFHEIPAEIGEFAILLHAGFNRTKVIISSLAAQMTALLGFVLGFYYLSLFENLEAILIAIAAGSFLYIAATDLLPETHREKKPGKILIQVLLLISGILAIWLVGTFIPE